MRITPAAAPAQKWAEDTSAEVLTLAENPVERRAAFKRAAWATARRRIDQNPGRPSLVREEEARWARLREYLREHDLEDTVFDPAD